MRPFRIKVSLNTGVPKRLYSLVPSRSDLNSKVAKTHERNFYEALSNKSSSQHRCAEATLLFSAVAQRLLIGESL